MERYICNGHGGPGLCDEYLLPEDDVVPRIIGTFKLLLSGDSDTINVQDNHEVTALHYTVGSHAGCGIRHSGDAIRFLCENSADPSLQDSHGQTVLHVLALRSVDGEPINTALLNLLISHGANITTIDKDGNTALHIMARNLRQVNTGQFLLSRGADVNARNAHGNTPLHEVMRGTLRLRDTRDKKIDNVTMAGRIRAQDEMLRVLRGAAGDSFHDLMEQPNAAGKMPRRMRDEIRSRWWEMEARKRTTCWKGAPASITVVSSWTCCQCPVIRSGC
ncbi:ankyrin repeat domain-containing protein [Aspergillus glaucus CBS 516.65]|uniref:Uncharacterized protein n=1 Tax=Aspergillus glaucus CBS 516.65 TaxID=1160497 RepID=A0A1L9V5Y7_ASPGL|nr:hypothetical protein ASPGLDRAFT_85943 [Aspergillus glaucus CBS 516.65]OJJ79344.1 hypothetical protein ASPGLDRAFT_85943 [Aspergillus glaucus CBS 516.65]